MNYSVIIAAAGSGSRANFGKNKLLYRIGDETVLEKCVSAFIGEGNAEKIVIAASAVDRAEFSEILSRFPNIYIIDGGATRTQSVKNALSAIDGEIVLIHDGARPFVSTKLIRSCAESAALYGSGIAALPCVDTLAFLSCDEIERTARENVLRVQTPQAFKTELIKKAYASVSPEDNFTDDTGVYCKYIGKARFVSGEETNKKLTYRSDFGAFSDFRTGVGFDLHRLEEGRKLILGGVEIPHSKGLLGHSDADVLTHAIMDALLSSVSLRDIGYHFPDTDQRYEGACSMDLLAEVIKMLDEKGYAASSVSATVMAEKPKLSGYIPKITENIAKALDLPTDRVGIGCTTLEKIGIVGREEGIAAEAFVTVKSKGLL